MGSQPTTVRVEFFGIPRQRAGVADTVVTLPRSPVTLEDVLRELAVKFPDLATACLEGASLKKEFMASLGGRQFVASPETEVTGEESLLILSADSGG